jgi:hypothetical protein
VLRGICPTLDHPLPWLELGAADVSGGTGTAGDCRCAQHRVSRQDHGEAPSIAIDPDGSSNEEMREVWEVWKLAGCQVTGGWSVVKVPSLLNKERPVHAVRSRELDEQSPGSRRPLCFSALLSQAALRARELTPCAL